MQIQFQEFSKSLARIIVCATAATLLPALTRAAQGAHNPMSKFYVADLEGTVQINTGAKIDDLTKQSVYNAQGTVIETKAKSADAMVFSNGTGVYFDHDTRVEVRRFEQEPFVPNRTDMDTEPSVSQTLIILSRGMIAICTSKLVAGSTMIFRTPLASVNIRGGKVVIQSEGGVTKVSVLDGDATVVAGDVDRGGAPLRGGEQAVVTSGAAGAAPDVNTQDIPSREHSELDSKVTMACTSKRTVYFEVRTRPVNTGLTPEVGGEVTAFDVEGANTVPPGGPISNNTEQQVIVAVPVVPSNLPVQFDPSPAEVGSLSGTP